MTFFGFFFVVWFKNPHPLIPYSFEDRKILIVNINIGVIANKIYKMQRNIIQ